LKTSIFSCATLDLGRDAKTRAALITCTNKHTCIYDISSQSSYWYAILWEVFLDQSDSYFLFADLVGFYTHWVSKQEVGIWWVQKCFPPYGVPIWSLWPNIRFLPSTVTEKNVTKNILDGQR
jgi:hypothetical protein